MSSLHKIKTTQFHRARVHIYLKGRMSKFFRKHSYFILSNILYILPIFCIFQGSSPCSKMYGILREIGASVTYEQVILENLYPRIRYTWSICILGSGIPGESLSQDQVYLRPNIKNLSRGLNLNRGSNMVNST